MHISLFLRLSAADEEGSLRMEPEASSRGRAAGISIALVMIASPVRAFHPSLFDCAPEQRNYLQPSAVRRMALARQEGRGFPPLLQKKGERMGHPAEAGTNSLADQAFSLGSFRISSRSLRQTFSFSPKSGISNCVFWTSRAQSMISCAVKRATSDSFR